MFLIPVWLIAYVEIIGVFSAPYVRQSYSSRDCHGLVCPENTLKCVKNSVITDTRIAMKSNISCVGKEGAVLLTNNILEPIERKNGPIRVHSVTTIIEVDAFTNNRIPKPYNTRD